MRRVKIVSLEIARVLAAKVRQHDYMSHRAFRTLFDRDRHLTNILTHRFIGVAIDRLSDRSLEHIKYIISNTSCSVINNRLYLYGNLPKLITRRIIERVRFYFVIILYKNA